MVLSSPSIVYLIFLLDLFSYFSKLFLLAMRLLNNCEFYLFSVTILCEPNCGVDVDEGMHKLSKIIGSRIE